MLRSDTSLKILSLLRQKDRRLAPVQRLRFAYEDNCTGALSFPYSKKQLQAKKDLASLLELSEALIVEHANRRVDLFFYTLVAYYQTNYIPILGKTVMQHGKGRSSVDKENLTNACHSSLTPSLIDKTLVNSTHKKSLLSGTHFLDSLNSTVELPPFVNAFDDVLESACRPQCISILQQVAVGELNPYQGLTHFLIMMNDFFKHLESQNSVKNYPDSFYSKIPISPKLIDLAKKGTLMTTFSHEKNKIKKEYIQLLLRMTPDEKDRYTRGTLEEKKALCFQKYREIQQEILESKTQMTLR